MILNQWAIIVTFLCLSWSYRTPLENSGLLFISLWCYDILKGEIHQERSFINSSNFLLIFTKHLGLPPLKRICFHLRTGNGSTLRLPRFIAFSSPWHIFPSTVSKRCFRDSSELWIFNLTHASQVAVCQSRLSSSPFLSKRPIFNISLINQCFELRIFRYTR